MLGAAACGGPNLGQCGQVCERANACNVKQRTTDVDCANYCPDSEKLSREVGCMDQRKAHLDCWTQNSAQICKSDWVAVNIFPGRAIAPDEFTGCNDSAKAWFDCLNANCDAQKSTNVQCGSIWPF